MNINLKAPPKHEPVSVEETKAYLRLSSEAEEGMIKSLISASRAYVENTTGRALLKQGWLLQLTPPYPHSFPLVATSRGELTLTLPFPPLLEVVSFRSRGKGVPYILETDFLKLPSTFYGEPLSISFWAGYGGTPECLPPDLKLAVLMGTRFLYEGETIKLPMLTPYKVLRIV